MADLLTAVKSVRTQAVIDAPDADLTTLTSKCANGAGDSPTFDTLERPESDADAESRLATSPEDVLQVLRSQPSLNEVLLILRQLLRQSLSNGPFSLHCPGPLQAQIINSLLVDILPSFWAVLRDREKAELTTCLRNVAGMSALMARIRHLSTQRGSTSHQSMQLIPALIQFSEQLFAGEHILLSLYRGLEANILDPIKREMTWKEVVSLISSGKVSSTIAEAEDATKAKQQCWLAKGDVFAAWVGHNTANLATTDRNSEGMAAAAKVLARALSLGYAGVLLSGFFQGALRPVDREPTASEILQGTIDKLPAHVKRGFTEHALRWISSLDGQLDRTEGGDGAIPAIAACLLLLARDPQIKHHITAFLTDPTLSACLSISVRRATAVVLSSSDQTDDLYRVIETLILIFSDRLFIDHASNAQQESLVQTTLLLSGYLHRRNPVAFLVLGRSSNAIHGTSNRLDSSNSRARWLGMVFATAVSRLVDKEGSRMNFGTDELDTAEAFWYLDLVTVNDAIGSVKDFAQFLEISLMQGPRSKATLPLRQTGGNGKAGRSNTVNGKPVFGPPRPPVQTRIIGERVTEIPDDGQDEEDVLKPYAKPDSDPEDSDEDATLVNRHRVKPPVYIRDLMAMLRDDQSHDRFQLAIKHAAPLIRRKAAFGAEVKDHAEELCSILCNLQDPFETESFEELKIGALVAVLLADVQVIAPRLCQQAFSGDYSLAQRCIILSALGLGGRELAGFVDEDISTPAPPYKVFPTKRLPPRLHSIYTAVAPSIQKLDAASAITESQLIQPIALQAADQSTAYLDAVKVRTFSSRMDVERTRRKPAPNQLAKVFGESFFFPLVNRYQQEIAAYGTASVYASVPFVLSIYLKTLALLFHASGPTTIGLLQVTTEYWDLLLSLRGQAISDLTILQAVLFSLLTLLEVNMDNKRQIAQELPRPLVETQQWVDLVFERTGAGNMINEQKDDDEAKVRTLAAGVLVKIKEIIDAYQQQLIGYMP